MQSVDLSKWEIDTGETKCRPFHPHRAELCRGEWRRQEMTQQEPHPSVYSHRPSDGSILPFTICCASISLSSICDIVGSSSDPSWGTVSGLLAFIESVATNSEFQPPPRSIVAIGSLSDSSTQHVIVWSGPNLVPGTSDTSSLAPETPPLASCIGGL